jgi:hypothetical protein
MSMSAAAGMWIRRMLQISSRSLVFMGVALCVAIAVIVRIAVGEEGNGMTVYTSEMGMGLWSRQHIAWHGGPGTIGVWADKVRRFLGLPTKSHSIRRSEGESRQVSPDDVPYLTIPQLAQLLPSHWGWSFQIRVYDDLTLIAKSRSAAVARATGRLWKATVVCVQTKNHDDCRDATHVYWYWAPGHEPMVISC